jgi:hypothetical protein
MECVPKIVPREFVTVADILVVGVGKFSGSITANFPRLTRATKRLIVTPTSVPFGTFNSPFTSVVQSATTSPAPEKLCGLRYPADAAEHFVRLPEKAPKAKLDASIIEKILLVLIRPIPAAL